LVFVAKIIKSNIFLAFKLNNNELNSERSVSLSNYDSQQDRIIEKRCVKTKETELAFKLNLK